MSYLPVSSAVLEFFRCTEVADRYYITADMSLECYTLQWNATLALAVIAIVVYSLGIPIFVFLVLRQMRVHAVKDRTAQLMSLDPDSPERTAMRDEIRSTWRWEGVLFIRPKSQDEEARIINEHLRNKNMAMKVNREKAGHLFEFYRKDLWWWECIEITRRLAFSVAVYFFQPGVRVVKGVRVM